MPKVVDSLRGMHVCRIASYNEHTAALVSDDLIDFNGDLFGNPRLSTKAGTGGDLAKAGYRRSSRGSRGLRSTLADDFDSVVDDPDFSDVRFLVGVALSTPTVSS